MAIPSQPTTNISLGPTLSPTNRSIAAEFGDSAPNKMSEFYRQGPLVPNSPVNAGIPTSGTISMSQFNGASNIVALNYTISSPVQNLNLLTYATSQAPVPTRYTAGTPGYTINFTIDPCVVIGSTSTPTAAMITGTSGPAGWHPTVPLSIVNNGKIIGAGGYGGNGFPGGPAAAESGGTAFTAQRSVTIQNAGVIGGGGGGGTGGPGGFHPQCPNCGGPYYDGGGGGGGGAGSNVYPGSPAPIGGMGGTGGAAIGPCGICGADGTPGTLTTGGPGGGGGGIAGPGASGGNLGLAGGGPAPAQPGAAGKAVTGYACVTWQAMGTIQGPTQPTP